ncbi:hypothetical protein PR048_000491 [Dryococelus australis]|uniref:Guanine nucleotide-binding protein subunit beta-like protein 1 n=1 Tax=Dryococelus australis TaxID=614101 RepID=A0ABQ9IET2_9NEOP|nr:hypothetical protein PR048_000491 [Dryococelus australis]
MSDPEPKYILRAALPPIYCIHFWRSGTQDVILCGCEDGKVYAWDLETARINKVPVITAGSSLCMSMSSADDILVTQDKSGGVKLWSLGQSTWSTLHTIGLEYFGFCHVCISKEGSGLLVCPRHCGTLDVYAVKTAERCLTLKSASESQKLGEVMSVKLVFLSGIPYVLAAYENNEIHMWDLRGKSSVCKYQVPACPTALDFDDSSSMGLCGSVSSKISVFKLENNSTFTTIAEVKLQARGVSCIQIEPERNYVAVGCWNKNIQLLSWKNKVMCSPVSITVHKDAVQDICFSSWPVPSWESKGLMAACSKDSQVSLWDFTDTIF